MTAIRKPRAVILTALPIEYRSVRKFLSEVREETHPQGTVYERGQFSAEQRTWDVGIVEIGAGNVRAAVEAERAINHFLPDVAMFVGVAGGVKDVNIGDVVADTKVYGYESGKIRTKTFLPRPDVGRSTYRLEQRARVEARKTDWSSDFLRPEHDKPKVVVGPIAAGEKVVASARSQIAAFIAENYSDVLAIEMEGRGFLEGTHANHIDALVIRGISDLLSGKKQADASGSQELAARHASEFAFAILRRFVPPSLGWTADSLSPAAQRDRDCAQLRDLLDNVPTTVWDSFFEGIDRDVICDDIFHFWEGFSAEVSAGHFQLFDQKVQSIILDLHKNMQETFSYSHCFVASLSGNMHRFRFPNLDDPAMTRYEKWHRGFRGAASKAETAYRELLDHVKQNYPEINLKQVTQESIKRYREWNAELEKKMGWNKRRRPKRKP